MFFVNELFQGRCESGGVVKDVVGQEIDCHCGGGGGLKRAFYGGGKGFGCWEGFSSTSIGELGFVKEFKEKLGLEREGGGGILFENGGGGSFGGECKGNEFFFDTCTLGDERQCVEVGFIGQMCGR